MYTHDCVSPLVKVTLPLLVYWTDSQERGMMPYFRICYETVHSYKSILPIEEHPLATPTHPIGTHPLAPPNLPQRGVHPLATPTLTLLGH